MITADQTDTPGIGHNMPPTLPELMSEAENFGPEVAAFLAGEFESLAPELAAILDKARLVPSPIENDEDMATASKLIVEFREIAKRISAHREKEKAAYLAGERAVDVFFFSLLDKCERRDKKSKPGAVDVLAGRLTDYLARKAAAEEERRRQEAIAAERKAREEREKAAAAQRAADEAREAAERARKVETIAAKEAVATVRETEASAAIAAAEVAQAQAEEAHLQTLAKPADMVRTRVEGGPLVTAATEPYAEVEDEALLDKAKLWPFIKLEAKEQALRAWAKTVSHNQQMAGAAIGRRPKSVVR